MFPQCHFAAGKQHGGGWKSPYPTAQPESDLMVAFKQSSQVILGCRSPWLLVNSVIWPSVMIQNHDEL